MCVLCLQSLLHVTSLLAIPEYQEPILEGLLASIGGLDASLSKEAVAALLHTVSPKPGAKTMPTCLVNNAACTVNRACHQAQGTPSKHSAFAGHMSVVTIVTIIIAAHQPGVEDVASTDFALCP